jgi:hypothetical protein
MTNFHETTDIFTSVKGVEYKHVRLQRYSIGFYKATNTYFLNGKKVVKQERFSVEEVINNSNSTTTTKEWIK